MRTKLDRTGSFRFIILLCIGVLSTQYTRAEEPIIVTPFERPFSNTTFGPGEKLTFVLEYGFVTAGTATLEILPFTKIDQHTCYSIRADANSAKGFDFIYKVRDRMESFVDSANFFTRKFQKRLREGLYKDDKTVTYDMSTLQATTVTKGKGSKVTQFDSLTQDMLSALYFTRLVDLKIGTPVYFPVHDIEKRYPLKVEVQKSERITVPAGTFDCIVVEPKLQSEGIFKRKGRIWVWLTADSRRMPVKMSSELPIGSVTANLISYSNGVPTGKIARPGR